MSLIADSISKIVSIKIKPRHDSYTDQYNRIFMVKMCIIVSVITGVNYFSDTVSCIIANDNGMGGGFVGSTCWIQGFYIFKELRNRLDESGYYGIPRNMDYDGVNVLNQLCSTQNRALDSVAGCKPMKKVYYLQFQYMPFFMAALALFFYAPYIAFRVTNTDLVSLKDTMKSKNATSEDIVKNYFNYRINGRARMRFRVAMNFGIKVLYLCANLVAFFITDQLLNGDFRTYGARWAKWATLDNMLANDHNLKVRKMPKPGDVLLPSMGFCDVHEASRDVRNTFINKHKFICEISPHILYQYALVVLWFALVMGIILSLVGVVLVILGHLINIVCFVTAGDPARRMYQVLTLREIDYLEYIRRKSIPIYGEVIRKLRDDRADMQAPNSDHLLPPSQEHTL